MGTHGGGSQLFKAAVVELLAFSPQQAGGIGAEQWLHSCPYSSEPSATVLTLVLATWSSVKLVKMDSAFCNSEY